MDKAAIRRSARKKRKQIDTHRRRQAEEIGCAFLKSFFIDHNLILSYVAFNEEFSLQLLNVELAVQNKLVLPMVCNEELKLYKVNELEKLKLSPKGILEPNPYFHKEAKIEQIGLILVPGIAFDLLNHRLGYGLGFYDRLLRKIPKNVYTLGVGFVEQLVPKLPATTYDEVLTSLALF